MSINDEWFVQEQAPHADLSTVFASIQGIPQPYFSTGISKAQILNTFSEFILGIEVLYSADSDRPGEILGEINIEILGGGTLPADPLMCNDPPSFLSSMPSGKVLNIIIFLSAIGIFDGTDSILVLEILINLIKIFRGWVVIGVRDDGHGIHILFLNKLDVLRRRAGRLISHSLCHHTNPDYEERKHNIIKIYSLTF